MLLRIQRLIDSRLHSVTVFTMGLKRRMRDSCFGIGKLGDELAGSAWEKETVGLDGVVERMMEHEDRLKIVDGRDGVGEDKAVEVRFVFEGMDVL